MKRSMFIGSVDTLLGSYGRIQSNVLCKLFQTYIVARSVVRNCGCATPMASIDA